MKSKNIFEIQQHDYRNLIRPMKRKQTSLSSFLLIHASKWNSIAIVKKILKISSLSQLVHWETIKEQIAHRVIATLTSSYLIYLVSLPHDLAKKP